MQVLTFIKEKLTNIRFSHERAVNSIKTALACFIGLILVHHISFAMPSWLIISTFFVMATTIHVGGTLKRSYIRTLGTVIGACASAISLFLVGGHAILMDIFILLLITIFAYIASNPGDNAYLGLLGGFTIIMILINNNPSLKLVMTRATETLIGIFIGLFVSLFVFPIRSKHFLNQLINKTLFDLDALYKTINSNKLSLTPVEADQIEAELLRNFTRQATLLQEAITERKNLTAMLPIYQNILRYERGLFRNGYVLRQIFSTANVANNIQQTGAINQLSEQISAIFAYLIKLIKEKNLTVDSLSEQTLRKNIEALIDIISKDNLFNSTVHLNTYIFCINHLLELSLNLANELCQLNQYS